MKLNFYSDPGHGWLEVPEADYKSSGIRATRYSYYRPSTKMVYLEEDCDANTFIEAMKAKGITVEFNYKDLPSMNFIRSCGRMPGY